MHSLKHIHNIVYKQTKINYIISMPAPLCTFCFRHNYRNSHAVICDNCQRWHHIKCANTGMICFKMKYYLLAMIKDNCENDKNNYAFLIHIVCFWASYINYVTKLLQLLFY
jgi:hypothetical protein